jgi:hypothetical protein
MCFGKNIKRVGAWVLAFVVAQGMVYRWGYDVGYLSGARQGYGDFFEEKHSRARSDQMVREELAQAKARGSGPDDLVVLREIPGQ